MIELRHSDYRSVFQTPLLLAAMIAWLTISCADAANPPVKGQAPAGAARLAPKKAAPNRYVAPVKRTRLKIQVPCRAWVPKNAQPKALLLCVHGLGLNGEAFEEFGKQMQAEGIGTFAVDVRGFGTWKQLKGQEKCDFKSCIGDVEQALNVLHTAYPGKPVFVLGESMGGAIAMRVAADHPSSVNGLISCVPSGDRFHKAKDRLRVAMRLVTLRPRKPLDIGTEVIEEATNDPKLREKWKRDPLTRTELTAGELMQFQRFMNGNRQTAKRIDNMPVLMLVGMNDKLVKPEGTIELFEEIASEDKKLVTVKSAEHLIFEYHRLSPALKRVIVDWVLTHRGG
jgi:acylglycerol lipase